MPAVLVHGVPETEQLWSSLRSELGRSDVLTLGLPGFGTPRPAGFGATMDEYAAWLIDEVAGVEGPVDLVGHDWGAGFTLRLVSLRPDLVRSWVMDAAGLADVEFEWHEFAKVWQTPEAGEAFWEEQLSRPVAERAGVFVAFGVPEEDATAMAQGVDETMAGCILDLYRSATRVHHDWGPDFVDIPTPGMVVIPTADPFLNAVAARRSAERAGARVETLEGIGHWWMVEDPRRAAALLERFWSSVEGG
jgi:pimeloyl-ACP methyl ester carboxylesterase